MLALNKVRFQQGDFALSADFSVPTGARVAVIGPSGGGKSTFLNGIAGFITSDAGKVLWDGEVMPDHPGRRPLSILFQDHNLFPHLSVMDNVAVGISSDMRLSQVQREQVSAALEQVGLADKSAAYPRDLSGGQLGRVGLARVLLRQRPLLLLDALTASPGDSSTLLRRLAAICPLFSAHKGATNNVSVRAVASFSPRYDMQ